MNSSEVLPQEKMELDLEIPSLVQSDGHLRRSNSAPMINGLRLINMFKIYLSHHYTDAMLYGAWHMVDLWICHSSDTSQVFQREVLRSRRNSTTVVNRSNMVKSFNTRV